MHFGFLGLAAVALLVYLYSYIKGDHGPGSSPRQEPLYTDSFLPMAVQVLLYVQEAVTVKTVIEFLTISNMRNDTNHSIWMEITKENEDSSLKQVDLSKRNKVLLFKLKDLLWMEAKSKHLGLTSGFSDKFLKDMPNFSNGTVREQLVTVLEEMLKRHDSTWDPAVKASEEMIATLREEDSELAEALGSIEPLNYS